MKSRLVCLSGPNKNNGKLGTARSFTVEGSDEHQAAIAEVADDWNNFYNQCQVRLKHWSWLPVMRTLRNINTGERKLCWTLELEVSP